MIRWMAEFFENQGIESPRLVAELLICHVLQCTRLELYMKFDRPFVETELQWLRAAVRQIAKGIPLQHVTGAVTFDEIEINVNADVLIPRPETEEVLQVAKRIVDEQLQRSDTISVLDIGTGSGVLALSLSSRFGDRVQCVGLDVSENALDMAMKNKEKLGASNCQFFVADILSIVPSKQYDIVLSNPPYIPLSEYGELEDNVRLHEPRVALTDEGDGLLFYRRFAEIMDSIVSQDGAFIFECGWNQGQSIKDLFAQQPFRVEVINDLNNLERIVVGKRS